LVKVEFSCKSPIFCLSCHDDKHSLMEGRGCFFQLISPFFELLLIRSNFLSTSERTLGQRTGRSPSFLVKLRANCHLDKKKVSNLTAKEVCDCELKRNGSLDHSRNGFRTFWLEKWTVTVSTRKQNASGEVCKNNRKYATNRLTKGLSNCFWLILLMLRCGDIHQNPGPNKKLLLGTYNVR
jgi:hypothetical protein